MNSSYQRLIFSNGSLFGDVRANYGFYFPLITTPAR